MAFITYMHGGYASAGDLISSTRDSNPPAGATPMWSTLSWNPGSQPGSTALKFQVAASNSSGGPFNFVGPDTTASTFFTTNTGVALDQFNGNRYLKYRAYLTSSNSANTPTVNDVTLCYAAGVSAGLSITNTDNTATVTAGDPVTYIITASNAGPGDVTGAPVVDNFPAALTCMWTCAITGNGSCTTTGWGNITDSISLTSGSKATYTAMCAVASNATGSLSNTATITPPTGVMDANSSDNSVTDTDSLAVTTNVTMSVVDGTDFVRVGQQLTYDIAINNANGPSDATVNISDILPAQLTSASWVCTNSGTATCASGSGTTLSGMATVPVGGEIDYLYTATLASEPLSGKVVNSPSATLQFGTNQPSSLIGASHTDTVVVFKTGFEVPPQ